MPKSSTNVLFYTFVITFCVIATALLIFINRDVGAIASALITHAYVSLYKHDTKQENTNNGPSNR